MGRHVVLAGDVGGTNVRLALFRDGEDPVRPEGLEVLPCRNYAGLEEALRDYLARRNLQVSQACLGVAGVIAGGAMEMVNLGWKATEAGLAGALGLEAMAFINDLEATAHGIEALAPADIRVLSPGVEDPNGNRCLIAAGTGLGETGMLRIAAGYLPFHSEGGHADFGPRGEIQAELLKHLAGRGRASWERVVSGPGLAAIYAFLRDTGRGEEPAWLAERLRAEDPGRVISEAGLSGESALCGDALDLFVSAYGAEAGNLALKLLATGGVYVGGGIAPKILAKLEAGAPRGGLFLDAFWDKGRLRPVLEKMPVKVILNDRAALLGAARVALGRAKRRLSA